MKQKFNFKALAMLVAASTVADNFDSQKQTFIDESAEWADPFSTNFRASIEKALKEYFGINTKEQLKEVTKLVKQLQEQTVNDLSIIKAEIERGFRKNQDRGDDLLNKLGFDDYWTKASHHNQTELIGLVQKFANNINDAIRTEMVQNKVNAARITNVTEYAGSLHKANVSQETLKGTSKVETEKAVTEFNEIYDIAMDICVLGRRLFKADQVKKDLFSFTRIVKNQGFDFASKAKKKAKENSVA